jgi:hypothetical protein
MIRQIILSGTPPTHQAEITKETWVKESSGSYLFSLWSCLARDPWWTLHNQDKKSKKNVSTKVGLPGRDRSREVLGILGLNRAALLSVWMQDPQNTLQESVWH